jgi:hypothetical protein
MTDNLDTALHVMGQAQLAELAGEDEWTEGDCIDKLNRLDAVMKQAREYREMLEDALVRWIQQHGDIVCGPVRYYAGTSKSTKCLQPMNTLEALLEATGGDVHELGKYLTPNPYRYGACRKPLGDKWPEHFMTTERPKLVEGKPKKQLQRTDERFLTR